MKNKTKLPKVKLPKAKVPKVKMPKVKSPPKVGVFKQIEKTLFPKRRKK